MARGGEKGGPKRRENRRRLLGDGVKSLNTSLEFGETTDVVPRFWKTGPEPISGIRPLPV